MSGAFGQQVKQATIDAALLTGPSEDLVLKTLLQLGSVKGFTTLFGPYKPPQGLPADDNQRWADYQRFDWSLRQLPAISIYESQTPEQKDSDQAFLRGMISFMIVWPASMRRSDGRRVEAAFKGALQNFFSSKYVSDMLDEIYYVQRPMKVAGLNEYGKTMTWTPNTQTFIENEACPVTIIDANYRIDLRAWYRWLEFNGRTKADPFDQTLADLTVIGGVDGEFVSGYSGIDDAGTEQVLIPDEIEVSNP